MHDGVSDKALVEGCVEGLSFGSCLMKVLGFKKESKYLMGLSRLGVCLC